MTVRVTTEHIANGLKDQHCRCPVALAMLDCKLQQPSVTPISVSWGPYGDDRKEIYTPIKIQGFIYRFDNGDKMEPFEFELKE